MVHEDMILAKLDQLVQGQEEMRGDIAEMRADIAELRAGQEELRTGQEELRTGQEELRTGQEELRTGQEELRTGQEELWVEQKSLRAEMNDRFDGLERAIRETRTVLVEAVDIVGDKVDGLGRTVVDLKLLTTQNTCDIQMLRAKAQ